MAPGSSSRTESLYYGSDGWLTAGYRSTASRESAILSFAKAVTPVVEAVTAFQKQLNAMVDRWMGPVARAHRQIGKSQSAYERWRLEVRRFLEELARKTAVDRASAGLRMSRSWNFDQALARAASPRLTFVPGMRGVTNPRAAISQRKTLRARADKRRAGFRNRKKT